MTKVDPRLKYLQTQKQESSLRALESVGRFGLMVDSVPAPTVRVLVQFAGDAADLEKKGLQITSIAGDVAAGSVALDKVDALAKVATVSRIESSRPLTGELDASIPEIRAHLVHTGPPGHRGAGVIIGIIDTGVDWQHEGFRRQDGTSRILRIWDQGLTPMAGATEHTPAGYTYGVEYTKSDIDVALANATPAQVVRHKDSDTEVGHGTHVSGIAAGDGSIAGNGQPAFTFAGVAPEADIILVANQLTTEAMGDSASTLDAVAYIFDQAASLNRPVVINLSQGDNLGPHDGTSLLERGIDNLLGGQGRGFVKSAGNEGSNNRHATGTVAASAKELLRFQVPSGDSSPDTIDIWYAGADRLAFSITPPGGAASATVTPGNTKTLNLPNGNSAFVDSTLDDPNNHDNRIYLQLSRGTATAIEAGNWTISLTGTAVTYGRFHAWIERGKVVPQFLAPHVSSELTISVPGTAHKVITAASYVTKGTGVGSISSFCSRGPTRDGRVAPTIAAPGQSIMSARAQGIADGSDQYHLLDGTSMSAPHVTGVIALMLQVNSTMTQDQIRDCLTNTARADAFTGVTPNTTWGAGKIDAKAAFDCAAPLPTLKISDEAQPTLKIKDELLTLKFVDEPLPTLKIKDELPTLKFVDEPKPTLKITDEPATMPVTDLVKAPALDKHPSLDAAKMPGSDLGRPPAGPGRPTEAAPFVLATPHHTMAWAQSFPEVFAAMLAEYESRIAEYEQVLAELDALYQRGLLTPDQLRQAEQLYQEYRAWAAEYQALTQRSQGQ
jgi:subtilisin family serine protease